MYVCTYVCCYIIVTAFDLSAEMHTVRFTVVMVMLFCPLTALSDFPT